MTDAQTTYDRATSAYDKDHERALLEAITRTIFETSAVSDADAVVRTGEIAAVLITALACTLAPSPSATRTSAAIRKVVEDIGKSLRRLVASIEEIVGIQEFLTQSFSGDDIGGNA